MKTSFKIYALIWAIGFAIFNLVAFIPVVSIEGAEITSSFVVANIFCDIMFIAQLGCGYFAFKPENKQKMFYNIPLVTTSLVSLFVTIVAAVILALIPDVPNWLTALVLVVITLISVVAILKSHFVAETVAKIDDKVKAKTFFIKNLTVDAETLISKATTEEAKAVANNVYEAIRYSDPMTNDALSSLESEITNKFNAFENAVVSGESLEETSKALLILVEERNQKCKLLK